MSRFYANITLQGPAQPDVLAFLNEQHEVAYVSTPVKNALVVFHEDLSAQEDLAARLSKQFACPALLVMAYGEAVLLYHLYQNGVQTDAYVSSPHAELELESAAPPGNAEILCAAFEAERFERRVTTILNKEGKPGQPYAYAANRHGELVQALGLPVFAAATGFQSIELGEMPAGKGFDVGAMLRTR